MANLLTDPKKEFLGSLTAIFLILLIIVPAGVFIYTNHNDKLISEQTVPEALLTPEQIAHIEWAKAEFGKATPATFFKWQPGNEVFPRVSRFLSLNGDILKVHYNIMNNEGHIRVGKRFFLSVSEIVHCKSVNDQACIPLAARFSMQDLPFPK